MQRLPLALAARRALGTLMVIEDAHIIERRNGCGGGIDLLVELSDDLGGRVLGRASSRAERLDASEDVTTQVPGYAASGSTGTWQARPPSPEKRMGEAGAILGRSGRAPG
jgi:hypothetical protein